MLSKCSSSGPTPALGAIPAHLMQWAAVSTKLLAIKVPPHVCLHVLSFRYWREIWRRGHVSVHRDPIPCPAPPTSHPSPPTPATVLTCQGQLWGTALSPPTTRAARLGWKVGTPQLEAGETGEEGHR